jgi:PAS domain S-box-containing protein
MTGSIALAPHNPGAHNPGAHNSGTHNSGTHQLDAHNSGVHPGDPPPEPPMASPYNGRQLYVWWLQAFGFVLLVGALTSIIALALRTRDADAWVEHTLEARRASGALFSTLLDAEASARAFLLASDPTLLTGFETARAALPQRLHDLTQQDPNNSAQIDAIVPLIQQRMAALADSIAIKRSGDQDALDRVIRKRDGANLMAQIRHDLTAFDQAEADQLAQHETVARDARSALLLGGSGALSLALLLGGFTVLLGHSQTRALRRVNIRLAGAVSDRTTALRSSETRFQQVFHDSPVGLTISTAETRRIVAANPAFCRMFDYSEPELFGRTDRDLVHPDDVNIAVPVASVDQTGWRPTEMRYITKSGEVLFGRVSLVPMAQPAERENLILGSVEDLTHEKRIEAALRDRETTLRLAVEAAGLGVYEHDVRRRAVRFDARAAALTGGTVPADAWLDFDSPELVAWNALIDPEHAAARQTAEHALLDGSTEAATSEYRLRTQAGTTWISMFGTVAEREAHTDHTLRVLTVVQDITQRKEAEITLRHAQRMEAIGQLTGGVAHDFNNLLGAILGHSEFLLDLLPEQSEERLLATEILDCALNGSALTQRLLAFARRQPLQPAVIDLNEYLPVHVSLLQRTLGETVTVRLVLGPELWLTLADPSQIVDVLLNLGINARDAMPQGGMLTIATANAVLDATYCVHHPEATPGEYVVLSVTDTGTGMSADVLTRAMEPFFTTKPIGKGSGLGLSTIYGFARQSGGYLSIDSTLGDGTTVRLYLPRTQAERSVERKRWAGPPPLPRGHEAILVVDDNATMRATAARNLTALGYRVRLAGDGPGALAILRAGERFDLLFTDLVMPNGLSGYQLADAAQALQPDLPVLFTTGFAPEDDHDTGVMDANALRKPYRRRELAERIRARLDKH